MMKSWNILPRLNFRTKESRKAFRTMLKISEEANLATKIIKIKANKIIIKVKANQRSRKQKDKINLNNPRQGFYRRSLVGMQSSRNEKI